MSKHIINGEENDIDRQIGMCLGLGMTQVATAEHLNLSTKTIFVRTQKNSLFIQKVIAEAQTVRAKTIAVIQADLSAKEEVRARAWSAMLKRLKKADGVDEGTMEDATALGYIREGLDRTEGRAVNRIAMLSRSEQVVTHEVSSDLLDALESVMREQRLLPEPAEDTETEDAIEAEMVLQ